jgi:hypothetical protein
MSKAEILAELPKLGRDERLEIFERLCALRESEFSDVHQKWVDEALSSGPARPASVSDWEDALNRGLYAQARFDNVVRPP